MIYYAKSIWGDEERKLVNQVFDNDWFSGGHFTDQFEKRLAEWWGVKYAIAVNSGSSANFIAMQSLELPHKSEVLTMAMGFPTTVSPILYHNLEPVYLDCDIPQYTIKLDQSAVSEKTKALFFAHTLGNVANMEEVVDFCKKNKLKLIEDCCDAVGSTWDNKKVGTFGDLATVSFYPAHHMTTFGEGGAILTNDPVLDMKCRSIRDWGKACYCKLNPPDNGECGARFKRKPFDHRYFYSRLGLNLKMTEASAAFGVAQLDRIDGFIQKRKENFEKLYWRLVNKVTVPEFFFGASPSWFSFPIMHEKKHEIMAHLEKNGVQTRALFAGNLLKHPAFKGKGRTPVPLTNSDKVLEQVFFIGLGPAITEKDIDYMVEKIMEVI